MTNRGVEAFVDAILADQPSKRFSATPDDADLLRLAIELHVSRSGKIGPDPQFVRELGRQLAAAADTGAIVSLRPGAEASERRPAPLMPGLRRRRGRTSHRRVSAHRCRGRRLAPGGRYVRCRQSRATCAASSRGASSSHCRRHGALWHPLDQRRAPVGHAYAYNGDPSWVMMDVVAPGFTGVYHCELQLADGAIVTAGSVAVHNGTGEWARFVRAQGDQLRRAVLVTSTGVTVATATFS